eukprot:GHVQ01016772.1.p1 GENE.GHVQ01016772.1~~GHVQ01016772.1.p1  ORF type:complete len:291 (+),score=39.47 GHVQ01016772.1:30-902(+)
MRTPPAADTTTVIHTPHTETKPNESSLNFKPKPTEFDNQLETPQINSPTQNHSTQNEMDLETRDFIAKAEQAALDFRAMIWAPPLPPAADTTTVIHTPHTETKPNESSLNFKPKPTEFAPGLSDDVTTISARGDTLIDDTTIADSKPSEEELKKLEINIDDNFKNGSLQYDNQLETSQINSPTPKHSTLNEMDLEEALDFRERMKAIQTAPPADTTTVIDTPHTETKPNESSLNFKPKPTEFEEELKKLESMFVNSRCWGFCVFCCMSVLVCMCVCVCACVHVCCMYVMV